MAAIAVIVLLALASCAGRAATVVSVDGSHPHAHVDREYVSFNIDASLYHSTTDLSDPKLIALASAWTADAPSYLRVGGTMEDYAAYNMTAGQSQPCPFAKGVRCYILNPSLWTGLLNFANKTNLSLVFGLNDLFGRKPKGKPEVPEPAGLAWNASNTESLLRWTAANTDPARWPFAFELGNELNEMLSGSRQAEDVRVLSELLADVFGTHPRRPRIVAPDPHSSTPFAHLDWVADFCTRIKSFPGPPIIHAFTYHMYSLGSAISLHDTAPFFDPEALDKSATGASAISTTVANVVPDVDVWAGETAAANGGGACGITNRYVDGFWYLDQLGTLASYGQRAFCRQSLFGSCYGLLDVSNGLAPRPDFFVALVFKRLMGQHVLKTTSASRNVRAYAHCHPANNGSVSVALLNLANTITSTTISIKDGTVTSGKGSNSDNDVLLYLLTAPNGNVTSNGIELNGVALAFDSQHRAPPLHGKPVPQGALNIPARSFGFVHLTEAAVKACSQ
eukprot:m.31504 g.31504  ORF g.31504 m.31504 type:complete len:507 (-) comp9765_c0_seq1:210-1730(-)